MYEYYYKTQDFGMCLMEGKGSGEEAIIPTDRDILIVGDDIFKGHKELVRVEFPDTVIEIGGFVFDGCICLLHKVCNRIYGFCYTVIRYEML